MKKMFFIAALGVASVMSAKNTVETKKIEKKSEAIIMCSVTVTFYNQYGQATGTQTFTNESSNNMQTCSAYEQGIIDGLNAAGKRFTTSKLLLRLVPSTSIY